MTDDGDAKQWVTTKVPKEQKDKARDYKPDESTFGDCLVAGAERLNDALDRDTRAYLDGTEGVDVDELARQIVDQIGSDVGGPSVDDSEIARAVARELDYVELADRVSENVVGQLEGLQR